MLLSLFFNNTWLFVNSNWYLKFNVEGEAIQGTSDIVSLKKKKNISDTMSLVP